MEKSKRNLAAAILSISLLTVMAGAAVAPALGVISLHFAKQSPLLIQMIISMPAMFIIITNFVFPYLCRKYSIRTLIVAGLALYVIGGCAAGCFDNIFLLLAMRALVGVGVGILMPLSTGLLTFYFPPSELEHLMGYSSAMNQMGGAVATLLAGVFASFTWRASFLVYALGIISILLCAKTIPNDMLAQSESRKTSRTEALRDNIWFVLSMFLLMAVFFFYPANFAVIATADGAIPYKYIAVIMAAMDIIAFFGGLAFARLKTSMGSKMRFFAPLLFLLGYLLMAFNKDLFGTLTGSLFIGFANGAGIPYIISAASRRAGRLAATTVMPLLSMALYIGQFAAPFVLSAVATVTGCEAVHLPYYTAAAMALLLLVVSKKI